MNPYLTPGMHRALADMKRAEDEDRLDDAEIVQEGIECWIGERRIHAGTVLRLLSLCLIRADGFHDGKAFQRFELNEDGRAVLASDAHVPRILAALREKNSS